MIPSGMKVALVATVVAFALGLVASASGAIRITRILYNPPGNDTQANSQLVKEFIELKNTGRGPVALTGWTIVDVDDKKRYRFPTFTLAGGATVRVRSGSGRDTRKDLYWGHDNYIWNNDETETAVIRNRGGKLVVKCTYRAKTATTAVCP
jgi:hypothetical protein